MYRTSQGHTEGEPQPVQLLITSHAAYVLLPGKAAGRRHHVDAKVNYTELDYLAVSD